MLLKQDRVLNKMQVIKRFKIIIIIIGIFIFSLFLPIIPTMGKQDYDVYGCEHLIFRTSKDIFISNKDSHNILEINTIKRNKNCSRSDPMPYNFNI